MLKATLATLALGLIYAQPTLAVDTSGCSSSIRGSAQQTTVQGKLLQVSTEKAPRASCWNAKSGRLDLSLKWDSEKASADTNAEVVFWVRVNGAESKLKGVVTCETPARFSTGANTSGQSELTCVSRASLTLGTTGAVQIEVAPEINGRWDTAGFGQNYNFSL